MLLRLLKKTRSDKLNSFNSQSEATNISPIGNMPNSLGKGLSPATRKGSSRVLISMIPHSPSANFHWNETFTDWVWHPLQIGKMWTVSNFSYRNKTFERSWKTGQDNGVESILFEVTFTFENMCKTKLHFLMTIFRTI